MLLLSHRNTQCLPDMLHQHYCGYWNQAFFQFNFNSISISILSVLYWHDKNYTFVLPKQLQLGCSQIVHIWINIVTNGHITIFLWVNIWAALCKYFHMVSRHVGACFNFDKEYLFGFETLVFATSGISSIHNQLVTLQRERKTWNRILWPL